MHAFLAVLRRDLRLEARRRETVLSMGVFAATALLVFAFSFDLQRTPAATVGPAVLWVTALFAATVGLSRVLAAESENDAMTGLLLAPVDRSALYFAKVASAFFSTSLVEAASFLGFVVLFDPKELRAPFGLFGLMLLATLGFIAAGVVLAGVVRHARGAGGTLLQVLLLPLAIPVFLGAIQTTSRLLRGLPLGDSAKWVPALAAFDALYLALGALLFERALEE